MKAHLNSHLTQLSFTSKKKGREIEHIIVIELSAVVLKEVKLLLKLLEVLPVKEGASKKQSIGA